MTAEMRVYLRTQIDRRRRELLARRQLVRFCESCFEAYDSGRKNCSCSTKRQPSPERRDRWRLYKQRYRAAQRGTPARAGRAA